MQPDIHGSFDQETALLRRVFAPMGGACSAYVLGDSFGGLQWHVFVANAGASDYDDVAAATPPASATPVYTLEVCMTGLCPVKAAQFARDDDFMCSAAVTAASGIRSLLPGAEIDDYVFEPCGYSMNGIEVRFKSLSCPGCCQHGCPPLWGRMVVIVDSRTDILCQSPSECTPS